MAGRLLALVGVLALVAGCSNGANVHRLHLLQADPVLRCHVSGATPWLTIDSAGTTHGIGFGGTSPTTVSRVLHLSTAPVDVLAAYLRCAVDSGWSASLKFGAVTGTKRFDGGWVAALLIGAGKHDFRGGQAVSITIETDPV